MWKHNFAHMSQTIKRGIILMNLGSPDSTEVKDAFEGLLKKAPALEEVLAIPLYPHYAMSSYETAVEHAKAIHKKNNYKFRLSFIQPFYNEEHFIEALAESMRPYLQQEYDQIL